MRAGMRFFTAMLRMSLRNRQGLFWTLFFPVMFMLATGLIGRTAPTLDVAVVAGAPDPLGASLVETLREVPGVSVATFDAGGQAEAGLAAGDLDAAIVLPPGFGAAVEAAARGGEPVVVEVMYRKNDPMVAQAVTGIIAGAVREFGIALAATNVPIRAKFTAIGSVEATYLEFVLPGLVGVMIMNASLAAIGMGVTGWRDKGILKRLRATPLSPAALFGGLIANQVLIGILSVVLMLLLAIVGFEARVQLRLGPLMALVLMGLVTFLALGFLLAGLVRRPESAPPLINLITLSMMVLSGVFFPAESLPGWLQVAAGALPLTFLVDGLRHTMSAGAGWSEVAGNLAGLAVWAAAAVAVATRTFRWDGA